MVQSREFAGTQLRVSRIRSPKVMGGVLGRLGGSHSAMAKAGASDVCALWLRAQT